MTSFPPTGDRPEPEPESQFWPDIPTYVPTWLLDTPAPASPPLGLPLLPPAAQPDTRQPDTRQPDTRQHHARQHDAGEVGGRPDDRRPYPRRGGEPDGSWREELNASWRAELDGAWHHELDDPWLDEPRDPRQRALYHLWREEPNHVWEPDAQLFRPDLAAFRADPPSPRGDVPILADGPAHRPDPGAALSSWPSCTSSPDTAATQVRDLSQPAPSDAGPASLIPSQDARPDPRRMIGAAGVRTDRALHRAVAVPGLGGRRPGRHLHRPAAAAPAPVSADPCVAPGASHDLRPSVTTARARRRALLAGAGYALAAAAVATGLHVLLIGPLLDGAWPGRVTVLAALVTGIALAAHQVLLRRRSRAAAEDPGTAFPPT